MGDYSLVTAAGETLAKSRGFTGKGKATYPNEDTYEGEFKDGLRHGKGVYTTKPKAEEGKGDTYEGNFTDNVRTSYVDGKPVHLARMTYEAGGFYHGYILDGKRHGEGTMKYPNGDVYSGYWEAGKKHGVGTYVFNTTKYKFVGDWVQGQMQEGRWVLTNGAYFSGVFADNKPAAEGTWTMANKDVVEGDYSRKIIPVKTAAGGFGTEIECTWSTYLVSKGA